MSVPKKIWIYRMVHYQNVEYILNNGICCREHSDYDPDYINIGHQQLIADRHEYPVGLDGAGNLGEYVPFYFAGHTPMLYLIMNGYKGVEQRRQEDIVFFVSSLDMVKEEGLEYIFTDMNAKRAFANFYDDEADFDKIKWDIVRSRDWSNHYGIGRQDYKQAEFLVRNSVPVSCIEALVVKTEERQIYFQGIIDSLGINLEVFLDKNSKLYY